MNELITIYLELFSSFFLIGLFTIGGGYAMLSLIEGQAVGHGWLSEAQFTDIVGISQMTPGPIGINSATYVGYTAIENAGGSQILAVLGSCCSTIAVVLPSFLIMLVIVRLYTRLQDNRVFKGVMSGLRPAVVGLIGAAALILMFNVSLSDGFSIGLMEENFSHWTSWLLFAAAFAITMWTKVSPITIIVAAGIIGLVIY